MEADRGVGVHSHADASRGVSLPGRERAYFFIYSNLDQTLDEDSECLPGR